MRYIIAILSILLTLFLVSQAEATFFIVGPEADAGNGCPSGTYSYAWDGETNDGTDYECVDSGSTTQAHADSGGTFELTAPGNPGNAFSFDGTANTYMEWTITDGEFNEAAWTVQYDIYITSDASETTRSCIELTDGGSNDRRIEIVTSNSERTGVINFKGWGVDVTCNPSDERITLDTWNTVSISGSAGGDLIAVDADGDGYTTCAATGYAAQATTHIDRWSLGENEVGAASTDYLKIDNVYIMDGYQSTPE